MTKKIFRTTLLSTIGIVCATIFMIMLFLYNYFNQLQHNQLKTETALAAQGISFEGRGYFENLNASEVRITWVDNAGTVLYDTEYDYQNMKNHADREEIQEAFEDGYGESSRWSPTLTEESIYAAQLLDNGTVVRLSVTRQTIVYLLLGMIPPLIFVVLLAIVISTFASRYVARKVAEPLNQIDLDNPLSNESYEELTPLLRRIDSHQGQIKEQESLLKRHQKEFDTIISKIKEGMVLLDDKARIVSINKEAQQLFQIEEEWENRFLLEFNRDLPLIALIDQGLKGHKKEGLIALFTRSYRVVIRPTKDQDVVTGLVVLLFDVTDQLQMEQLQREFTANVSHELKTPLHVISGYSELLEKNMVAAADVPKFAAKIHTESNRLVKLVNDLINLSRLDEEAQLPKEEVNLYQLTKTVISKLQPAADQKEIDIHLTGQDVLLQGNARLLESMVKNLCENAILYNKEKGRIDITVGPDEKGVAFTIKDTGIGIEPKEQERIFERFYRVDKSHSKTSGGTGLGLSIVKGALQFHRGEITLTSKLSEGTSIHIVLQGLPETY